MAPKIIAIPSITVSDMNGPGNGTSQPVATPRVWKLNVTMAKRNPPIIPRVWPMSLEAREGPLYGVPSWVVDTTIFWSASLVLLEIGGILLILSSCLGFVFAAQEFSRIYVAPSETSEAHAYVSEVPPKRRKSVVKRKAGVSKPR